MPICEHSNSWAVLRPTCRRLLSRHWTATGQAASQRGSGAVGQTVRSWEVRTRRRSTHWHASWLQPGRYPRQSLTGTRGTVGGWTRAGLPNFSAHSRRFGPPARLLGQPLRLLLSDNQRHCGPLFLRASRRTPSPLRQAAGQPPPHLTRSAAHRTGRCYRSANRVEPLDSSPSRSS